MIKSFKCKETKRIWNGSRSSKLPENIQNKALRKLRQLDAAQTIADLRNPPGNKLEALKGNRKGQYSIRIDRALANLFCLVAIALCIFSCQLQYKRIRQPSTN